MNRRSFIGTAAFAGLGVAAGAKDPAVGRPWAGWREGSFQFHVIYNGRAESDFCILPDGTTMLIDSGDYKPPHRQWFVSTLPDNSRGPGEWVARYVARANPAGRNVDYFMLSHYHADHGGSANTYTRRERRDGQDYFIGGLAETAEFIHFDRAFDRCWPTYDDPLPLDEDVNYDYVQIRRTWEWLQAHAGLQMEKFRLGAVNQVAMRRRPSAYPGFSITNICANGRILRRDGTVRDLYADYVAAEHPPKLNENGMSLGLLVQYGPFRLYTAGDFSDRVRRRNGATLDVEAEQAAELDRVDVAKLNHHGCVSMPEPLVKALAPRVWLSATFASHHNDDGTLARCTSRALYAGPRTLCPNIMPACRLAAAARKGLAWPADLADAVREEMHVVVDVAPGGETYTVNFISAADESMTVRDVLHFRSGT